MKEIRYLLYAIVTIYIVIAGLGGNYALVALKSITPFHMEYKAMMMAIPAVVQPILVVLLLAYIARCVDKD